MKKTQRRIIPSSEKDHIFERRDTKTPLLQFFTQFSEKRWDGNARLATYPKLPFVSSRRFPNADFGRRPPTFAMSQAFSLSGY